MDCVRPIPHLAGTSFLHWGTSPAPYGLRSVTLARRDQGTAGHSPKGIGKKRLGRPSRRREHPGCPDFQTIEPSMDGAARSVRARSEDACKGRPPDPGLPVAGLRGHPAAPDGMAPRFGTRIGQLKLRRRLAKLCLRQRQHASSIHQGLGENRYLNLPRYNSKSTYHPRRWNRGQDRAPHFTTHYSAQIHRQHASARQDALRQPPPPP